MSLNTNIQWCDSTINPIMGCGATPLRIFLGGLFKSFESLGLQSLCRS